MSTVKESEQTRPLFEKAVTQINTMLDKGAIEDKEYAALAMRVFTGHIKVLNSERATDVLKFMVAKVTASNSDEVKEIIQNSLPEYTNREGVNVNA